MGTDDTNPENFDDTVFESMFVPDDLTPEQARLDLAEAGWEQVPGLWIWKSPTGSFYRGPFGAWRQMKIIPLPAQRYNPYPD